MTELEQYLNVYFDAGHAELQEMASQFQPMALHKGDYLLKAGRICDRLAFIRHGLIRIYVQQPEKEITQWIATSGYFVTDLASFIFRTPARWHIQALTDCELFVINHDAYSKLGQRIPEWHRIEKMFIAKCFIMLEERVFGHLSMTAEERFQKLIEQQPDLFNKVPLQYLASMLGMTPETMSRIRRKMLG